MRKKMLFLVILSVSICLLCGCMKTRIYTVEWDGWSLIPNEPVVNERVHIHISYLNDTGCNRTVLFHWVITEGYEQSEFITLDTDLILSFDTPGKKEVFLWAEGVNYGESFQAKPYFFDFEVADIAN